jgi:hypothetical protein
MFANAFELTVAFRDRVSHDAIVGPVYGRVDNHRAIAANFGMKIPEYR